MGLAFCDAVITETQDRTIILVDNRGHPGGHWNDAYPYVRLHQPSAYYGVMSRKLETSSQPLPNGLHELASQSDILAYFQRSLERMVASGRLKYYPMHTVGGDQRSLVSLLSGGGKPVPVRVRRSFVDGTFMNVVVPSMRPPPFPVAAGVRMVPLNLLPKVQTPPERYVVVGSGKTGMDAVMWLLNNGVPAEQIGWVMPRDAWYLNRAIIQPGKLLANWVNSMLDSLVGDPTPAEVLLRMEQKGSLLRLDTAREPTMWHCATVTEQEVRQLRSVRNVYRQGHVKEILSDRMVMVSGEELLTGENTLYVDCTANALSRRPAVPVFTEGRITLQSLSQCQQVFSAAMIGHLESTLASNKEKNRLSTPVPHPDKIVDFFKCAEQTFLNEQAWQAGGQVFWMLRNRLAMSSHESWLNVVYYSIKLRLNQAAVLRTLARNIRTLEPAAKL
eukprot:TRINITY_DN3110_c4_g1_i1.p1 TRINITY_DN3110_c4_g1~~TRINITY_DN3110_c4_g1_i1.p1  ORF type:complete len:478 (+),score=165.55 TRINITY_DN3110_c4_g1_i1:102-1436(+)